MKWEEYIEYILDEKTALDELLLSSAGEAMPVSPIVKASVLMLESELQSGSRHNVFVYPERWGKSQKKNIKRILKKNSNSDVLNKYLKNKLEIPEEQFDDGVLTFEPNRDELDEIEIFIKENQYRQYSSSGIVNRLIEE